MPCCVDVSISILIRSPLILIWQLVLHEATDTTYALKAIRKGQVIAMKQVEHVMNEKRLLAMCDHPFLLNLAATFQVSHHPCSRSSFERTCARCCNPYRRLPLGTGTRSAHHNCVTYSCVRRTSTRFTCSPRS